MSTQKLFKSYPDNPMTKPVARNSKNFNTFKSSWTIEAIDAPGAWLIPRTTNDVIIGVADSGLNIHHRDLKGLKVLSKGDIKDNSGHGTAVIGVFGAQHNTKVGMAGVSPNVGVIIKKVEGEIGDGLLSYFNNDQMSKRCKKALTEIYDEVCKNPAIKIVVFAKAKSLKKEKDAEDFSALYYHDIIEKLLKKGVIVILAGDNKDVPVEKCYPAMMKKKLLSMYSNLLIVSSCDKPTGGIWEGNISQSYPKQTLSDVLAPGTNQVTLSHKSKDTYNLPIGKNQKNTSGNSLAIPHLAGVAGILFKINPSLSGEQVSKIIIETAEEQVSGAVVLNAFAAAIKAYNLANNSDNIYGYRFILPSGYEGGIIEVNGTQLVEIVSVRCLGITSFCRFISKEENINIKVFPPIYDNNGNLKISKKPVWVGNTRDIISQANTNSKESAWEYKNCNQLKTIRLQGLSLKILEENNPLSNKYIVLKKDKKIFESSTDNEGFTNISFGEPGTYTLIIKDTRESINLYEIEMNLEKNNIYEYDPRENSKKTKNIILKKESTNILYSCWVGEISYEGNGEVSEGELINASGTIILKCVTNKINKKIFLYNCFDAYFPGGVTLEEAIEEWGEDFADDELPSLKNIEVRVFSELLYKLYNDFKINDDYLEDYIIEYEDGSNIPKGFQISDCETYKLDLSKIIPSLIEASLKNANTVYYPFKIDITYAWYVENILIGDGLKFNMTYLTEVIQPYEIPIEKAYLEDNKLKITAGPCKSNMKFIYEPSVNIKVLNEESKDYLSALIDTNKCNNSFIYVLGTNGEVGRIEVY